MEVVDSGSVDLKSVGSSSPVVAEDFPATQESTKIKFTVSELKKDEEKEEKRITPTQVALETENSNLAIQVVGEKLKILEEQLKIIKEGLGDYFKENREKIDEIVKEMNKSTSAAKKSNKQLVTTLQKLIDEQFGDDSSSSESDSEEFKTKRKRK